MLCLVLAMRLAPGGAASRAAPSGSSHMWSRAVTTVTAMPDRAISQVLAMKENCISSQQARMAWAASGSMRAQPHAVLRLSEQALRQSMGEVRQLAQLAGQASLPEKFVTKPTTLDSTHSRSSGEMPVASPRAPAARATATRRRPRGPGWRGMAPADRRTRGGKGLRRGAR